jgi:hypothetical protein
MKNGPFPARTGCPATRLYTRAIAQDAEFATRLRFGGGSAKPRTVPGEPELRKEILRYFLEHPDAVDDLEGISRWRLRQLLVERSVLEAREALDWLVEKGYLDAEQMAGTHRTFRLSPSKKEDAKRLVGEGE